MPPLLWLWIAALLLFSVAEAATNALVSLWFIGGTLAAGVLCLLGLSVGIQLGAFFLVSLALLLLLRPLARRYLSPKIIATNARSNIGKTAVVTEAIDNLRSKGAVAIGGLEWSARSVDGSPIEKDAVVVIRSIEGVKVCVEPVKEDSHV